MTDLDFIRTMSDLMSTKRTHSRKRERKTTGEKIVQPDRTSQDYGERYFHPYRIQAMDLLRFICQGFALPTHLSNCVFITSSSSRITFLNQTRATTPKSGHIDFISHFEGRKPPPSISSNSISRLPSCTFKPGRTLVALSSIALARSCHARPWPVLP